VGLGVSDYRGMFVLSQDCVLKGEVRNCRQAHLHGYVEGTVYADDLIVHEGGRCYGTVRAGTATIAGTLQGDVFVKNLIRIDSGGDVTGNIHYGQLAMETGGHLSADLHNVPPSLSGDMSVSVRRGGSVVVSTQDLTALDPDDRADQLNYRITTVRNGYLALSQSPNAAVYGFTQEDLAAGRVMFVHDGAHEAVASFDAVVADHTGATSGPAQTVSVAVAG
jgi:cytoskeletal protein CcmA (bactofilin family)